MREGIAVARPRAQTKGPATVLYKRASSEPLYTLQEYRFETRNDHKNRPLGV
jgi:hypothetical protein